MVDVLSRHVAGATTCVAAFASGGEAFHHAVPAFEWQRTLDGLGVSYILLRDSRERWWQEGVAGIGNTAAVVEYLRDEMNRPAYESRFAIGLSSGAFAALMYGQLVPVDEVIAISPLTLLGPAAEAEFGPGWAARVRLPAHQAGLEVDLRPLFEPGTRPAVRAFVSDGDGAELDARMCGLIGLTPNLIPGHTHAGLAKHMVEAGMIEKLIVGGT